MSRTSFKDAQPEVRATPPPALPPRRRWPHPPACSPSAAATSSLELITYKLPMQLPAIFLAITPRGIPLAISSLEQFHSRGGPKWGPALHGDADFSLALRFLCWRDHRSE